MPRLIAALAVLLIAAASGAETGRVIAPSSDDAHVWSSEPDRPFPNPTWLVSGTQSGDGVYRTFVRFPLPKHTRVVSATLHAHVRSVSSSGAGAQVIDFVADDGWSEQTLTWNDQPAATGERIATLPNGTASWQALSFDVTDLAQREQADGVLSIRVAALDDVASSANWNSREDPTSHGFYLELDVEPAPRLKPGDFVVLSVGGLHAGVVAINPERALQKPLAAIRFVGPLGAIAVDPQDGGWISSDFEGLMRFEAQSGNPFRVSDNPGYASEQFFAFAMQDGALYAISAYPDPTIVRIDTTTGARQPISSGGFFCDPTGLALREGELLVADPCGLVRVALSDGAQTRVPIDGGFETPEGIAIEPDGGVLVAVGDGAGGGRIARIDLDTGAQQTVATLPFAPGPIAVDAATSTLWVGSRPARGGGALGEQAQVGRVDPLLGTYTGVLRTPGALGGLALDATGAPLVTLTLDLALPRVVRIDPTTGSAQTVAAPLAAPRSGHLFFDADQSLLAVLDDRIVRVDPVSGRQSNFALIPCAEECYNLDAAQAPDGRLVLLRLEFTGFDIGNALLWIDPRDGSTQRFDTLVAIDQVAVEKDGSLVLAYSGRSQWLSSIYRMDAASGSLSVVTSGPPLGAIDDLAIDASGAILVANAARNEVLRVDAATGAAAIHLAGLRFSPLRMVSDAAGRIAAWGDIGSGSLAIVDPDLQEVSTLATESELPSYRTLAWLAPACANGRDDDGDGFADLADPGCATATGVREDPQCDNGRDDDRDGRIDLADPSCTSSAASESACGLGAEIALVLAGLRRLHTRSRRLATA
jgi:sugar lactone lactonase YvrE